MKIAAQPNNNSAQKHYFKGSLLIQHLFRIVFDNLRKHLHLLLLSILMKIFLNVYTI